MHESVLFMLHMCAKMHDWGISAHTAMHCVICLLSPNLECCLYAADTPGASVGDIAKALGELWKGLSDGDKKPYQVRHPQALHVMPYYQSRLCS